MSCIVLPIKQLTLLQFLGRGWSWRVIPGNAICQGSVMSNMLSPNCLSAIAKLKILDVTDWYLMGWKSIRFGDHLIYHAYGRLHQLGLKLEDTHINWLMQVEFQWDVGISSDIEQQAVNLYYKKFMQTMKTCMTKFEMNRRMGFKDWYQTGFSKLCCLMVMLR
jgi:hypothetical protein